MGQKIHVLFKCLSIVIIKMLVKIFSVWHDAGASFLLTKEIKNISQFHIYHLKIHNFENF